LAFKNWDMDFSCGSWYLPVVDFCKGRNNPPIFTKYE